MLNSKIYYKYRNLADKRFIMTFGINEMEALVRLCEGNPYTVKKIFETNSGE